MARLKKLKAETPTQKVILEYLEKNVSESLAERIKEETYYKLEKGEFVEVK